jgi:hypothetical protein
MYYTIFLECEENRIIFVLRYCVDRHRALSIRGGKMGFLVMSEQDIQSKR